MDKKKPWLILDSKIVFETPIFNLCASRVRSTKNNHEDNFYSISTSDWVNVIPITSDGQVILIRQYRHGIDEYNLECPGGLIDITDNTPLDAARRELLEETGYSSQIIISLGWVHPNPAFQQNHCHYFLALDACKESEQNLEPLEVLDIYPVPLKSIEQLIADGDISHAVTICGFTKFFLSEHSKKLMS